MSGGTGGDDAEESGHKGTGVLIVLVMVVVAMVVLLGENISGSIVASDRVLFYLIVILCYH